MCVSVCVSVRGARTEGQTVFVYTASAVCCKPGSRLKYHGLLGFWPLGEVTKSRWHDGTKIKKKGIFKKNNNNNGAVELRKYLGFQILHERNRI